MLEKIDHINVVVDDLEAMVRFYRDVLGLVVSKRVCIEGSWIERTVGLVGVVAHVVYLDPPQGPRVELIEYERPRGERPSGFSDSNTRGIRHLAFRVDNIDQTVQTLRAAGVSTLSDVQQVPDSQVQYAGSVRKRLIYFHDPEGNLLELCEYK